MNAAMRPWDSSPENVLDDTRPQWNTLSCADKCEHILSWLDTRKDADAWIVDCIVDHPDLVVQLWREHKLPLALQESIADWLAVSIFIRGENQEWKP